MKKLMWAVCTAVTMAAGTAVEAQRSQPLPPPMLKEGVTQKIAEHVYVIPDFAMGANHTKNDIAVFVDGDRVLQDELQRRYNRGQMASAVRAAYDEAQ